MKKINQFFLSISRREGYNLIDRFTNEGINLIFLVGEVGVGKSRFIQHIPEALPYFEVVILGQFYENSEIFFRSILKELGYQDESFSKSDMIHTIAQHATDLIPEGKRLLLVVDDVSGISPDIVNDLVKLFDFEYEGKKILSVMLSSSNVDFHLIKEWETTYFSYIKNSVIYLKPFNKQETIQFFKQACEQARIDLSEFSENDMIEVYRHTEGIPYRISKIPELLNSFGIMGKITIKDVQSIIKSTNIIKNNSYGTTKKRFNINFIIISALIVIGIVVAFSFYNREIKKVEEVEKKPIDKPIDNQHPVDIVKNDNSSIEYNNIKVKEVEKKQNITKPEVDKSCIKLKANLKVRLAPSTDSSFKTVAPKGSVLSILDKKDEWYKITYNGITGWVKGTPDLVKNVECNK
ncbi:MAG: SH3 domain-containing protein [Calditerrivibrio sp.]|nr:SH3 domain-containing protein [Calditerrivibrio sp.]MCA1932698.1 SH3 domain-containing protein [Calditerrivibrio sp.]MCA1980744.1 SH3 domain-containing protein [Calditerrivibrio sp.]